MWSWCRHCAAARRAPRDQEWPGIDPAAAAESVGGARGGVSEEAPINIATP